MLIQLLVQESESRSPRSAVAGAVENSSEIRVIGDGVGKGVHRLAVVVELPVTSRIV